MDANESFEFNLSSDSDDSCDLICTSMNNNLLINHPDETFEEPHISLDGSNDSMEFEFNDGLNSPPPKLKGIFK